MDIVAPPKMAEPPKQVQDTPAPPAHAVKSAMHHSAAKPHVPPHPQGSGLGLVVAATVIIVLGLGAFMVYAYLRTNGISIF